VHVDEQDYIRWREDLVTLRPGREHAWLDRGIETCLHILQGRVPRIQVRYVIKVVKPMHSLTTLRTYSHPVSAAIAPLTGIWKADLCADNQRKGDRRGSSLL
jgi:hypothetical protein